MRFELRLSRDALAYLNRLDMRTQQRFARAFEILLDDPFQHTKPLRGSGEDRSARVGDWRVIFHVDRERRIVFVTDVGPRGQIYRNL